MTKAELIRKIAKRAGVPDSEAKVFFEIFLKKTSELLSPGEAIFLKGFGHFQLRKGKIRPAIPDMVSPDKDSVFVELMVYYPAKYSEEEIKKEIIFNVPVVKVENYNPLDSYFSLSIGKPIIPVEGASSSEFFIPLTGQELRKLVEGRVDKLISEITIVKEYTKGNEVLIIDTDSIKSHQLEFNWGEVPSKNISDSKLTAKSKDAESEITEPIEKEISWDFGEDISKEIVEESILDVDKEETLMVEEQLSEVTDKDALGGKTDWNFGVTMVDEDETEPEEENENEKLHEATVELVESRIANEVEDEDSHLLSDDIDSDDRFERVRSFSSYFEEDDLSKLQNSSSYRYLRESDTIDYENYEADVIAKEVIREFNEPEEEFDQSVQQNDEINTKEEAPVHITDPNYRTAKLYAEEDQASNSYKPTKNRILTRKKERQSHYSREGVYPVFIIAIIAIIVIAIALYFYLTNAFVSSKNTETSPSTNSKVLDGNNKNENVKPNAETSNSKVPGNVSGTEQTGTINSDENKNAAVSGMDTQQATEKNDASSLLHENISSGKKTYTVQISSWQSESVAEQQAAKFRSKGYDAFVEKANVPGKGIWYRVKVRNFKSKREAEKFLLSNQQ